jgi:hypothetical protein
MRRYTPFALLIFIVVSCSSTNPVLERQVFEWHARSVDRVYDGKGLFRNPMPLAVGQYTVYRIIDGNDRQVMRNAVVGREGDGWIFETWSLTPSGQNTTQMLLRGVDKAWETLDPDQLDIVWVKIKSDEGKVQTVEGPALSMMKGTYKNLLNGMYLKFEADEGVAAVKAPAGVFNECTRATTSLKILFWSDTVEAYYHPTIPLNGIVRSVSKDKGVTMELIEFGLTGATPTF